MGAGALNTCVKYTYIPPLNVLYLLYHNHKRIRTLNGESSMKVNEATFIGRVCP